MQSELSVSVAAETNPETVQRMEAWHLEVGVVVRSQLDALAPTQEPSHQEGTAVALVAVVALVTCQEPAGQTKLNALLPE